MEVKTRSRNGCFTCRRRKKKCDESLYPDCKNCKANGLICTWPDHVVELHKEAELLEEIVETFSPKLEVRMVPLPKPLRPYMESYPSVIHTDDDDYQSPGRRHSVAGRISKPEKKGRNYFLERIAMQQDCVDDRYEDESTSKTTQSGEKKNDIKSRIAQQLDVAGTGT
ncbi:CIC11C00000004602 [Sungouiella intermedia]|uniref:CIC11C00000004602 n=1 Tax=Sungouiella intermedia TaxID=45354 RepID=A0A1L0B850_9ASCO|nr:CIC11C00000004602 [[Candida] intermedia]